MALLQFADNLDNLGTKSKKGTGLVTFPAILSPDGRSTVGQPGTRIRSGSFTSLTKFTRGAGSCASREGIRRFCLGVGSRRSGERIHAGDHGGKSAMDSARHGGRRKTPQ